MYRNRLLLFVLGTMLSSAGIAQYSNATLTGPWFLYQAPLNPYGGALNYLVFDGNGGIVDFNGFCPTFSGSYSVAANGSLTANLVCGGGGFPLTGQLNSLDSATCSISGLVFFLSRISDPAAMAGVLTGTLTTQNCGVRSNVTLDVNTEGVITAATGLVPLVTGRIYADQGVYIGHIRTGEAGGWQEFSIWGYLSNDTLTGQVALDQQGCGTTSVDLLLESISGIPDGALQPLSLSIFPNPASTLFQLGIGEPIRGTATVNLFDTLGKQVLSVKLTRDQQMIDISALSIGSYVVQVITEERTGTQRLVVQR